MRRIVCLTWRGLIQHFSLRQADCEAEVLGCIREAVDDVLYGFLSVGEKGTVVSKQQLSDEFLDDFRACGETPKIDETVVCLDTEVDAVWQVTEHGAEAGEQRGSQNASLPDAFGDGEAVQRKPIVFHLTLLTLKKLAENGEYFCFCFCWGQGGGGAK